MQQQTECDYIAGHIQTVELHRNNSW